MSAPVTAPVNRLRRTKLGVAIFILLASLTWGASSASAGSTYFFDGKSDDGVVKKSATKSIVGGGATLYIGADNAFVFSQTVRPTSSGSWSNVSYVVAGGFIEAYHGHARVTNGRSWCGWDINWGNGGTAPIKCRYVY